MSFLKLKTVCACSGTLDFVVQFVEIMCHCQMIAIACAIWYTIYEKHEVKGVGISP